MYHNNYEFITIELEDGIIEDYYLEKYALFLNILWEFLSYFKVTVTVIQVCILSIMIHLCVSATANQLLNEILSLKSKGWKPTKIALCIG